VGNDESNQIFLTNTQTAYEAADYTAIHKVPVAIRNF
jgi:hypothetical protein